MNITAYQLSVWVLPLIIAITFHEAAHGFVAHRLGDDTAYVLGRVSFNPIRHIDPFGTIVLPGVLLLSHSPFLFGYAKPVPVNPRRMRSPRNHGLLVSLAGPATNITIALLAAAWVRFKVSDIDLYSVTHGIHAPLSARVAVDLGILNVVLAAFNLIPLPPLDGSAVVERLLPARLWPGYLRIRQYSMGVLLILVFFGSNILSHLFDGALHLWNTLLR